MGHLTFAFLCIISCALHIGVQGESLFTSEVRKTRQKPACCNGEEIISCDQVGIKASVLGVEELYLAPLNATVKFDGRTGEDEDSGYSYKNDNIEMVLTHNKESGGVFGYVTLLTGGTYTIEHCGDGVHVLKSIDASKLPKSATEAQEGNVTSGVPRSNRADTTTVVTYSVKIYYTPQFAANTADIPGFVQQVIQITNQGYINTRVPLRVKLHCIERATLNDIYNPVTMRDTFASMKGSWSALRGSADAAALLVNNFEACGIAYINTIGIGQTISVTARNCAIQTTTFGHELGHNIGLYHNYEAHGQNPNYQDGHGHLIAQGSASRGYRTIMAYPARNHETQLNFYSTPYLTLSITGTPLGVVGRSYNVRILTANRFALANVGNEQQSCSSGGGGGGTSSCCDNNQSRTYQYSRVATSTCLSGCRSNGRCIGWVFSNDGRSCYNLNAVPAYSSGVVSGPAFIDNNCYIKGTNRCFNYNSILRINYIGYYSNISSCNTCQERCKGYSTCVQWRFHNQRCYIYTAVYTSSSSYYSGPRFC